jgi:ribosomal protein S18 acetylase RimI-like enzyme
MRIAFSRLTYFRIRVNSARTSGHETRAHGGIGVDPARQGLGLGSLLLRAGLARVDQDGVECQLFTEESRNVPLYQRHGFEIAVDGDLPDGGLHVWFMRRRPPIAR